MPTLYPTFQDFKSYIYILHFRISNF